MANPRKVRPSQTQIRILTNIHAGKPADSGRPIGISHAGGWLDPKGHLTDAGLAALVTKKSR